MCKKICKYFSKHPTCSGITHVLIGIGFGILITYPFVRTHPLRYGLAFIAMGVVGYAYAYFVKK